MEHVNFMEWGEAVRKLQAGKANGEGTSSSFRGYIAGKYERLCDERANVGGVPAGKIIADWLKERGAERRPANYDNRDFVHVPKMARPGALRSGCYMDISGAYYNILKDAWWDIQFLPSKARAQKGALSLSGLFPILPSKFARNSLVGMAISTRRLYWKDGVCEVKQIRSGFFNPQLAWYCWAILGACARIARDCGAVYWNVDGGIIPGDKCETLRDKVYKATGLTIRPKLTGDFIVWGVGAYTCYTQGHEAIGKPRPLGASYTSLPDPIASGLALRILNG